jgi:hypothetical protein
MNTNTITKRLRLGLARFRNPGERFPDFSRRRATSAVRRNILKKLSLRLGKKFASSS